MSQRSLRFWRFFRRSPRQALRAAISTFFLRVIKPPVVAIASKSDLGAAIYFTIFSSRFQGEQRSVLAGQLAFRKQDYERANSLPELRRNIHRLEKGLIMSPRRATFADAYIERTVQIWAGTRRGCALDAGEATWASDVLNAYFSVVKDSPRIAAARRSWLAELENSAANDAGALGQCVPYRSDQREPAAVSTQALLGLLKERRSVRWYQDQPVDPVRIDMAIAAASLAASACNRQPYGFIVLTDPTQAREAAALAGGTAGWHHQIPALIVVVGDMSCYPHERDRHVPYIDASLAVAQMLLALQTSGLSSCVINWPDVEARERAMRKLVGLEQHQRVIMLVSIGYADPKGLIPWSQKKPTKLLTLATPKAVVQ